MAVVEGRRCHASTVQKVVAVAIVALPLALALAQGYNETEVKAAFLYHFTGYVEYPPGAFSSSQAPLIIGVLGKGNILSALQQAVRGKNVKGRAIVVKQVDIGQELRECHIVFVPDAEGKNLPRILQILDEAPVLLVGESENFAAKGGTIGFFVEQNRIRFEVNLDAAQRAHLTISSKLLSLARIVKGKRRES